MVSAHLRWDTADLRLQYWWIQPSDSIELDWAMNIQFFVMKQFTFTDKFQLKKQVKDGWYSLLMSIELDWAMNIQFFVMKQFTFTNKFQLKKQVKDGWNYSMVRLWFYLWL